MGPFLARALATTAAGRNRFLCVHGPDDRWRWWTAYAASLPDANARPPAIGGWTALPPGCINMPWLFVFRCLLNITAW